MQFMKTLQKNSIDSIITDIPYDEVNRDSNGLRALDKGLADVATFDLVEFLQECYRVSKNNIIIFCSRGQLSVIHDFFNNFQKKRKGSVRQLIWSKTNPSPMNGTHVYLSSIENIVWFKKPGATFNAKCKKAVFTYPAGKSKLHPTEKNIELIKELILDNTNEGDVVFDPCAGAGTHLLAAKQLNRRYIGCEIYKPYYDIIIERLEGKKNDE